MTITSPGPAQQSVALQAHDVLRRRPSPDVEWVDVEGQVVAWNAETESLHLLDNIASLIFHLLDGVASLETTVLDLAEAFGRAVEEVRSDVLTFAESLQDMGITERVR